MMILLVGISVFAYSIRMAVRRAAAKVAVRPSRTNRLGPLPIAPAVDPAYYWRGDSGDWTASDERQLIRLLNDSAP